MERIAEKIARRRKEMGMTQKALAEKLHISDKTLSRWETGKQIPDALTLLEIANALEMPITEMYDVQEKSVSAACGSETTQVPTARNRLFGKQVKIAGVVLLILAGIVGLVTGTVNWHLRSGITYAAEAVPMYRLTARDHSILAWIQACDAGAEEVYLLSRLRTDDETGQDIACYLIYVPQGNADTELQVQYRLGLRGKVLKFDFRNTSGIRDGNYYLCYAEVDYDQEEPHSLGFTVNGKPVDHSSRGNVMGVNWGDFSLSGT